MKFPIKYPGQYYESHKEIPRQYYENCNEIVMTSNDYRIVNSQSQRIVHSEVQWAFKEC